MRSRPSRFPAFWSEQDAARGEEPLGRPLFLVWLRLVVVEEAAAVDRLSPGVYSQIKATDLH